MSFVPRHVLEGSHVKLLRVVSNSMGTFYPGHEFEVLEVRIGSAGDVYDLRDRDLNLLYDVAANEVEPYEPPY